MFCQRCGQETPDGASFCSGCGLDLGSTTPMSAVDVFVPGSELDIVREALAADYDVKEEIGRGGMATVYRAVEHGLTREVAIKVLPFSHAHDQSLVERFELEAQTAAKLEHPNIIPIYRVGRANDVIYFTMRYLSGPSLSQLIDELGPMDPDQIRRILVQSARALQHAHEAGVVHRDIKPDNILFKENGEAVVCDFGIAKAVSGTNLTGTGMAIGTPYYMSPEQVRAKPLDGRSDIYSLGVVAYQCMTTHVPFDGEDSFSIGYKHVMDDPPIPELRSPAHESLFRVIQRMMAKEPGDRFPSAADLVAALEERDGAALPSTAVSPAVQGGDTIISTPARRFASRTTAPPGRRSSIMTPTTPVPRISAERPAPRQRRPLRIAAMFFGVLFVLAGGGAGSGYYYLSHGGTIPPELMQYEPVVRTRAPWLASWIEETVRRAQPDTATADPTPVEVPVPTPDWTDAADSTDAPLAPDTTAGPLPPEADSTGAAVPDTAVSDTSAATEATPEPPPVTTGVLIVTNLGRRATLWIDERNVRGLRHELEAGAHEIRAAAPGMEPYRARVTIAAGDTVTHRVRLARRGQCERPGPTYNLGDICFDTRPALDPRAATLVPIDQSVPRMPSQPAELLVEVLADGRAGQVVVRAPSDVPAFAVLAVRYARSLTYEPARKNGRPVAGWLTLVLYAAP